MPQIYADVDQIKTWIKYSKNLCSDCTGTCCSLAVEVRDSDLIRMGLADAFEVEENPKKVAKRLMKEGIVEHYHNKTGLFTLSRMANGDCQYLHPKTRLCTIYNDRPDTCRNHPQVGPRPGFCAYRQKTERH